MSHPIRPAVLPKDGRPAIGPPRTDCGQPSRELGSPPGWLGTLGHIGESVLFCATEVGCVEVARLLVEHEDVDPALPDHEGTTPLFHSLVY